MEGLADEARDETRLWNGEVKTQIIKKFGEQVGFWHAPEK